MGRPHLRGTYGSLLSIPEVSPCCSSCGESGRGGYEEASHDRGGGSGRRGCSTWQAAPLRGGLRSGGCDGGRASASGGSCAGALADFAAQHAEHCSRHGQHRHRVAAVRIPVNGGRAGEIEIDLHSLSTHCHVSNAPAAALLGLTGPLSTSRAVPPAPLPGRRQPSRRYTRIPCCL